MKIDKKNIKISKISEWEKRYKYGWLIRFFTGYQPVRIWTLRSSSFLPIPFIPHPRAAEDHCKSMFVEAIRVNLILVDHSARRRSRHTQPVAPRSRLRPGCIGAVGCLVYQGAPCLRQPDCKEMKRNIIREFAKQCKRTGQNKRQNRKMGKIWKSQNNERKLNPLNELL